VTDPSSSSDQCEERDRYPEHPSARRLSRRLLSSIAGLAAGLAAVVLVTGLVMKLGTQNAPAAAGGQPSRSQDSATPTRAISTGASGPRASLGSDDRGFINSAARCEGPQTAAAIGRTPRSLVVICTDRNGKYEYRGVRMSDGATLKMATQTTVGWVFVARNDGVTYVVSPRELLVTSGKAVITREPMIEYREPRMFPAQAGPSAAAPTTTTPKAETSPPAR
jgi:ferric-dicitrate binding protein FerR (iron transport regulator)